ncbi:MAG: glycine cleavage system protein H [Candidatus Bipolaricaulota bacterium]|nr:glycine cleavage system protein H [Candidatus Bipolaricaulota bacterium]
MPEGLEMTAGKFTFRVPEDRLYTAEGIWVLSEVDRPSNRIRVGLTDYLQQHSGDVAFAFVKPSGARLSADETLAEVETIKTLLELPSPVAGTVVEVNPALNLTPEVINQDPYGEGWLATIEPTDWGADRAGLLGPREYLSHMQSQVQEELEKP